MRRIFLAAIALTSLLATPALAYYPMCGPQTSGKCQVSPTDGTVVYGCGDGKFVSSSCTTCGDACFVCSNFGQGCVSLGSDDDTDTTREDATTERHEMMACMPADETPRG